MPLTVRFSLLSFTILLTALHPGYSYAQQLSEKDSLQILQYANQLNRQLVKEMPDEDNKAYTDEIIDSILSSYRMGFGGGKVHYAPDSAFKIYIIDGNGCGPYGNESVAEKRSLMAFTLTKRMKRILPVIRLSTR
jgi:hypothetical protein